VLREYHTISWSSHTEFTDVANEWSANSNKNCLYTAARYENNRTYLKTVRADNCAPYDVSLTDSTASTVILRDVQTTAMSNAAECTRHNT